MYFPKRLIDVTDAMIEPFVKIRNKSDHDNKLNEMVLLDSLTPYSLASEKVQ
jgi:hypothetical protein